MAEKVTVTVISCGVLRPELEAIAARRKLAINFRYLPGGLHNRPDELRRRLQIAIDEASTDPDCSRIIIGYGLCGMGTVNIQARRVPLVFPRVHDCIALFLGSDQAYKEQFAREPGTYYISNGWVDEQMKARPEGDHIWIGAESMGCRQLTERYGKQAAGRIIEFFSSWQTNYRRAAFIDNGLPGSAACARRAEELARRYGWEYAPIKGDTALFERLLSSQDSCPELLFVPPGYVTRHDGLENRLTASPANRDPEEQFCRSRRFTLGEDKHRCCNLRYGLGIDAGGTYTDVVIHDFSAGTIIAKHKALTTKWRFSIGIDTALAGLPPELLARIEMVAVSTTLATNAIVEDDGQPTGLLVMAGPNPVQKLFPHRPVAFVEGRLNINGEENEPVNPQQIRAISRRMVDRDGVRAFAVSGFAGAINPQHELEVKRLIEEETGCTVCCGHELSDQLNLAVRAQTAVLNARIIPRMLLFFENLTETLHRRGVTAPVMVVKGDGTLMSAAIAREKPVETILSGPAASVAGARFLTGIGDGIVVDMGGTTTDTAALGNGLVAVCEEGAKVGCHQTHVRALKMRTSGLGGDSLIVYEQGHLRIGPRRVMPLVVAGAIGGERVEQAMDVLRGRLAKRPKIAFGQQIILATGTSPEFVPDEKEQEILRIIQRKICCLDELAMEIGAISHRFLPLERLEQYGLIQRCGLTPTDLLHVRGQFNQWPAGPAHRWLELLSRATGQGSEILCDVLLQEVEQGLARELLYKQLADETDIEGLADCSLCSHLADKLLAADKGALALNVQMQVPIIGIGAPIGHFLPQAAKRLGAAAIIPENSEVANAIGAITSRIRLSRQLQIRPDDRGRFLVEGIAGGRSFHRLEQAEAWAIVHLQDDLHRQARSNGTSAGTVDVVINDQIASIAGGQTLFLGRTIQTTLEGLPDLLLL